MASTAVATVLLSIGAALDYSDCAPSMHMPDFALLNYFLALGTFLFTFGGLAAFPTIQHDMKKPHEFTKSAIFVFVGEIIGRYGSYHRTPSDLRILRSPANDWVPLVR